jgi:hypothetical protein
VTQPRGLNPKKIIVKAQCPCGYRVRVTIFDKGEALDKWEISCQNHRKLRRKLVLGYFYVTGKPSSPDVAAEAIQRAIRDRVPVVRTTPDYEPFTYKIRF